MIFKLREEEEHGRTKPTASDQLLVTSTSIPFKVLSQDQSIDLYSSFSDLLQFFFQEKRDLQSLHPPEKVAPPPPATVRFAAEARAQDNAVVALASSGRPQLALQRPGARSAGARGARSALRVGHPRVKSRRIFRERERESTVYLASEAQRDDAMEAGCGHFQREHGIFG